MDDIEKCLKEQGINSLVETNGYRYEFNHNGLKVEFCAQSGHNANGRFVGQIYNENVLPKEISQMERELRKEKLDEEWIEGVRKYNYRRISINGYLDNIIPELIQLINMPIEEYISLKNKEKEQIASLTKSFVQEKFSGKL